MLTVNNAMRKVKKTATIFSVAVAPFLKAVTATATVAAVVATAVEF